ncbi:MAG: hypothetical protein GWN37_16555 [Gammaproteobacteria bacterium]|nr:hypothetical protein [Gammaproteobacteria bacterium]
MLGELGGKLDRREAGSRQEPGRALAVTGLDDVVLVEIFENVSGLDDESVTGRTKNHIP